MGFIFSLNVIAISSSNIIVFSTWPISILLLKEQLIREKEVKKKLVVFFHIIWRAN